MLEIMSKRTRVIVGNWKMNTVLDEAVELVNGLRYELDEIDTVEKIICPPFISLAKIKELLQGTSIRLGAQNLFYEDKGAYTGEVSGAMLSDLCQCVIVGHSERRAYFNEANEIVNRKMKAALRHGLKPIMCVGENLEQNESGTSESVISEQLRVGLSGLTSSNLMVAYEPVWAIGTGKAATGMYAQKMMAFIGIRLVGYSLKLRQTSFPSSTGAVLTQRIFLNCWLSRISTGHWSAEPASSPDCFCQSSGKLQ